MMLKIMREMKVEAAHVRGPEMPLRGRSAEEVGAEAVAMEVAA